MDPKDETQSEESFSLPDPKQGPSTPPLGDSIQSRPPTPWPSAFAKAPTVRASNEFSPPRRRSRTIALISLGLALAVGGGFLGGKLSGSSNSSVTITQSNSSPSGAVLPSGMTIPDLVTKVSPSVVSIDVKNGGNEDQGTGMIISSDGLVVTNNHVIALAVNGGTITTTRSGSTTVQSAKLIGTLPADDVALIQIQGAANLPAVTFGNSSKAVVGDAVVAIGNALGLAAGTPTVTQGIISALGRTVTASNELNSGTETLSNLIQTDAAINPGNSGGPLLDAQGDVIGMNTAVAGSTTSGSSAQNIGFAIPSNSIQELLPKLESGGATTTAPTQGYIGVEIATLTPTLKAQYHLSANSGVLVLTVSSPSPASRSGIHQGDVITEVSGKTVATAVTFSQIVKATAPGTVLPMTLSRGNKTVHVSVTVGSSPA